MPGSDQPGRVSGTRRENAAAVAGAAAAAAYAAAELAVLAGLTAAVRRAVALRAPNLTGGLARLLRDTARALAGAEQDAVQVLTRAGGDPDIPAVPGGVTPRAAIEAASARVYRDIPDIYQQAVQAAVEDTRGGQPYTSLSLSRVQAAQKALDHLAGNGLTGFTDRAGRNWDLVAYVEMATRTAVSNSYDNLVNGALARGGHDLIFTLTHSPEGSCPACLPWLGRVLSLTGATTGLVQITDHAGQLTRMTVRGTLGDARAAGFRHPSCRCSWIPFLDGEDLTVADLFAEPPDQAAATYEASQQQRALERAVRAAGRETATAMTPQARSRARHRLTAARAASAQHRARAGLRITRVGAGRREHPTHAH